MNAMQAILHPFFLKRAHTCCEILYAMELIDWVCTYDKIELPMNNRRLGYVDFIIGRKEKLLAFLSQALCSFWINMTWCSHYLRNPVGYLHTNKSLLLVSAESFLLLCFQRKKYLYLIKAWEGDTETWEDESIALQFEWMEIVDRKQFCTNYHKVTLQEWDLPEEVWVLFLLGLLERPLIFSKPMKI